MYVAIWIAAATLGLGPIVVSTVRWLLKRSFTDVADDAWNSPYTRS